MDSFRSWKPRPPSADLRRRLFGTEAAPASLGVLNWAVSSALSAAAVVLVALVPASPDGNALLSREAHSLGAFSALALTAQNTLPATTFTWTNRSLLPVTNPAASHFR